MPNRINTNLLVIDSIPFKNFRFFSQLDLASALLVALN